MASNIKKILVPTDFSPSSLVALDYAGIIANKTLAEITLLHVIEFFELSSAGITADIDKEAIQRGALDKLKEIKTTSKAIKGHKIKTEVISGKIYQEILKYQEESGSDIVVMGAHGASGETEMGTYMLGSNAHRVVHSSKIPVLTVRKKKVVPQFKNILLPLDIAKETTQKVQLAIEWAKLFGATIHVVTVSTVLDGLKPDSNKLRLRLKEVADEITKNKIACTTKMIKHAKVADSIFDYSKITKTDLVVIMKSQEAGWNKYVVGSRAKKVISGSEIPVISLMPSEF